MSQNIRLKTSSTDSVEILGAGLCLIYVGQPTVKVYLVSSAFLAKTPEHCYAINRKERWWTICHVEEEVTFPGSGRKWVGQDSEADTEVALSLYGRITLRFRTKGLNKWKQSSTRPEDSSCIPGSHMVGENQLKQVVLWPPHPQCKCPDTKWISE